MIDNVGRFIPSLALTMQLDPLLESITNIEESVIHTSLGRIIHVVTKTFPTGTVFYNAINTSNDKLELNGKVLSCSNIQVWSRFTGIKISPNTTCPNANCTNPYDLVGAHVVRDKAKIKVHSGDTVYLIPLCRSCNGKTGPIIINTNVTALVLTI